MDKAGSLNQGLDLAFSLYPRCYGTQEMVIYLAYLCEAMEGPILGTWTHGSHSWYQTMRRQARIYVKMPLWMYGYLMRYTDLARFPLSGEIHLRPDCMFYAGSDFYNLPMQLLDVWLMMSWQSVHCWSQPTNDMDFIIPWSVGYVG